MLPIAPEPLHAESFHPRVLDRIVASKVPLRIQFEKGGFLDQIVAQSQLPAKYTH